jgi:hypothetical protein
MLPHQRYVDLRPAFTFAEDAKTHRINGTAILPNSISTSVRCTNGRKWWRTERAARKDAAFQAYVALYEAGLVNNNLLPLNREGAVVRRTAFDDGSFRTAQSMDQFGKGVGNP